MFDTGKYTMADFIECRELEKEAYAFFQNKMYDFALEAINEALDIIPEDDRCWRVKALIYFVMSQEIDSKYFTDAADCLKKALLFNPSEEAYKTEFSLCLLVWASEMYDSKDFESAISIINDYLNFTEDKSSDDYVFGLNIKAISLQSIGHYQQALEYLDRALRINPESEQLKKNKLYCLNDRIRELFFLNEYEEAVRRIDEYVYILNNIENRNYDDKMICGSFLNLKNCISLKTDSSDYDFFYLSNSQEYQTELNIINEYMSYCKDKTCEIYACFLNLNGLLFEDVAEYPKAFQHYRRALEIWPENETIRKNADRCLMAAVEFWCSIERYDIALPEIDGYLSTIKDKKSKKYANILKIREGILVKAGIMKKL